jgi:hypothetical protein
MDSYLKVLLKKIAIFQKASLAGEL